jgi:hypothetical protein
MRRAFDGAEHSGSIEPVMAGRHEAAQVVLRGAFSKSSHSFDVLPKTEVLSASGKWRLLEATAAFPNPVASK